MTEQTPIYINAPMPDYTYVLRWWLCEPSDGDDWGTQAQVMVVRSDHPLTMEALAERLRELEVPLERYELVEMPRNSLAVLDTWESFIELTSSVEEPQVDVLLVRNWWDAATAQRHDSQERPA